MSVGSIFEDLGLFKETGSPWLSLEGHATSQLLQEKRGRIRRSAPSHLGTWLEDDQCTLVDLLKRVSGTGSTRALNVL